jgi:hypothetical protein
MDSHQIDCFWREGKRIPSRADGNEHAAGGLGRVFPALSRLFETVNN